jgi:hypothetical protein
MARHGSDMSSSEDDCRCCHWHRREHPRDANLSRRRSRMSRSRDPHPRCRERTPARHIAGPSSLHPRPGLVAPAEGMAAVEGFGRGVSLEKIMCTCRHCKGVVLQTRSQVRSHLGNHGPYRPPPTEVNF